MAELRVGLGFDSHPSDPSRPLWLAGVTFEDEDGLGGHSDGDVVCHAVADALLGAAGLADLGEHFPETDPALAGIAGRTILGRVVELLAERGFAVSSCDVVIIAERPAVAPRRAEMREALAEALRLESSRVSVKASRPEGLGLSGDGAACLAVAVVDGR